jgi:hypothetical protein
LLAAVLDRRQWIISPRFIVARPQRFVQRAIRFGVRIQPVRLSGQKRVRPARRRDQRDSPGLRANTPRCSQVETPPWSWRRRIEGFFVGRLSDSAAWRCTTTRRP